MFSTKKFTELAVLGPIDGTEIFAGVSQGGVSSQVALDQAAKRKLGLRSGFSYSRRALIMLLYRTLLRLGPLRDRLCVP